MEKPIGKAIMLCDQVIDDRNTGKKTLVGLFTNIGAAKFPAHHNSMAVYVALTNGTGAANVKLILKRDGDGKETKLFEAGGKVEFINPNQVIELVFNLLGMKFDSPGQYVFEVYANSEYIFGTKFSVTQLKASSRQ